MLSYDIVYMLSSLHWYMQYQNKDCLELNKPLVKAKHLEYQSVCSLNNCRV